MKLTEKLLGYLNRVFDKEPKEFLAFRLRYDGAMVWQVTDGVLTTAVTGGTGAPLAVALAGHTLRTLIDFLAAQPGYSLPYGASSQEYLQLSALALLDAAGDQDASNGDHLHAYTSLLYAYMEPVAVELQAARVQVGEMIDQMSTKSADGEWLDEWGDYFGVKRDEAAVLVQPERRNLMAYSECFSASVWVMASGGVLKSNTAVAPNGIASAGFFTNTSAGASWISQLFSAVANTTYTCSVYVKPAGLSSIRLDFYTVGTGDKFADFNLTTGVASNVSSGVTAAATALDDGWWRLSITVATGSNVTNAQFQPVRNPSAGNLTSGVYFWGAQVEIGVTATDYMPSLPTFTSRASTATYFDASGTLKVAAVNAARTGYVYVGGRWVSAGLLVENAATNLLAYSEYLWLSSAWTVGAGLGGFFSVSPSAAVPDPYGGGASVAKFVANASPSVLFLRKSGLTLNSGWNYAASILLYVPSQSGVTSWGVTCDFSDAETSALFSSSKFDTWVWVQVPTTTLGAARTWVDFNISVNGGVTPAAGFKFYATGAHLGAAFDVGSYIPTLPTFTSRASVASYFDADGLLKSAAINVARTGYRLKDGAWGAQGLLLEGAATNPLLYSEQFDNAAWGASNITVTANAVVAPSGAVTADKIVESTATGGHQVWQASSCSASTAYTFSVFLKAAGRTLVALEMFNAGGILATVDLGSGIITVGTPYSGASLGDGSLVSVGGGWWRASVTMTTAVGAASVTAQLRLLDAAGSTSYTGNGTSGVYAWGAQVEAGSYPTSYIATTSAAVTRAADVSSSSATTRSADVTSNVQGVTAAVYGAEVDADYGRRIIAEVLRPRGNNVAMAAAISEAIGQAVTVTDVRLWGPAFPLFNSVISHDGTHNYDASATPVYGLFDVEYGYDLESGGDMATFAQMVRGYVDKLRDAGTQLRAIALKASAMGDTFTAAPDDGGALALAAVVTEADPFTAPTESTTPWAATVSPFADTASPGDDTVGLGLSVGYTTTYNGLRFYNGAVPFQSGTTLPETL